ncbi:unnamed protein product [Rotaria socialis]|uniref:G-protein coupled receptors family 1 profile domain-containing protein n=5 Tax=Rotaria socialis TaxID=392032 RepID=A0A817WLG2_9BILA|nr:unnamed protein product [Rotaria socialis]CAF3400535.1 unnamed protein product [Rotaria socialis]CAF3507226.1 unnamed protein product [Rotaria socialis]
MPKTNNFTAHILFNNSKIFFNTSLYEIKQSIDLTNSILALILSCFCMITIFGNALVIYAVIQERYLKSVTYYYMASLACADLFVGLGVMPFAIIQIIYGEYWPFGKTCCDIWHSIDVCASTASILDLCVIALDRYSAITNPISYHRAFFVKRWPYLIATVWLCSGLISFPAIAYWRLVVHQYEIDRCLFPDDIYYILVSSLISFYIPLFVMIFVYIRIYRAAIKQLHAFKTGVKIETSKKLVPKKNTNNENSPAINISSDVCLRIHRGKYHGLHIDRELSFTDNSLSHQSMTNDNHQITINKKQLSSEKARQSLGKRLTKFSREQKATVTLAYVMGIFVICWLPFFVYNPLTAISKLLIGGRPTLTRMQEFLVGNGLVFQLFTWFGYINSSVNPIIYAYSSREFRRAFIKYLCRCFPTRLRNFMMSYHNLHLLRYRCQKPSSVISGDNIEYNSDNTNKQFIIPSSSASVTAVMINTKDKNEPSIRFLTKYSHRNGTRQKQFNNKPKTGILVKYCNYHDASVSRVTCL